MKRAVIIAIAVALAACTLHAQITFSNNAHVNIPQAGVIPSLYPVSATVTGITTNISRLRVSMDFQNMTLNGTNMLLLAPNGARLMLLAAASNQPFTGTLTIDSLSATPVPGGGNAITPGNYRATSYNPSASFPVGDVDHIIPTGGDVALPAGTDPDNLNRFLNIDPNGTWSLFITCGFGGGVMTRMAITIDGPPDFAIGMAQVGTFAQDDIGDRYHIFVANSGASVSAGGVTVTVAVPTGLTTTNMFGVGWSCNLVTCSRTDAISAQSGYPQIVLVVDVASDAPTIVNSTASIVDTGPGNNQVTVPTQINRYADLGITIDDGVTSVVAGMPVSYTIVATNHGPKDVAGAYVSASLSYLQNITYTATQTGGATGFTASGSNQISEQVNMPALSTITYSVDATLAPNATGFPAGTYQSSAYISAPQFVIDTDFTNSSATDNDTLVYQADLSVTKSAPALAASGTDLTWTVVVSNAGPSDAHNVTLTDILPAGFVSQIQTDYAGGYFNPSNDGDTINDLAYQFAAHASATLQFVGHIPPATLPNTIIANTVTVASADDTTTGNNSAFASTLTDVPDLAIAQIVNGNAIAGQIVTFTVTVSNAGGGSTNGEITVTDVVSAGLNGASLAGAGWVCTGLTCTTSDILLPGDTSTLTLTATVDAIAPDTVTSTATISGGSETNLANDSASVNATVYAPFGAPQNVIATHTSTSTAHIQWRAVLGAVQYVVARDTVITGAFSTVMMTSDTHLDDSGLDAGTTYLYKVRAVDAVPVYTDFSGVDPATTIDFDDALSTPTTVQARHINQLRTAVDAMRVAAGLPKLFDAVVLQTNANITTADIEDLRTAIAAARGGLSIAAYSFPDAPLVQNVTPVRAVHILSLRTACE